MIYDYFSTTNLTNSRERVDYLQIDTIVSKHIQHNSKDISVLKIFH